MGESARPSRALAEASRWFTALKRSSITAKTLYDFREWRREPAHAAAFAEVERTWESAGALHDRPAIQDAVSAALASRPAKPDGSRRNARRWAVVMVAAASILAALGVRVVATDGLPQTYETPVGGQRLEVLKDGSRVRLNTDSKIRVRFERGERRIDLLRGQAFFEAAHDARRPFIVTADGAVVRALGTKFDVRRVDDAVRVTLVEGRVQVRQTAHPRSETLTPDQTLTVTPAGISAPTTANLPQAVGWTTGRLTFSDTPLAEAVQEINRYSMQKITLAAPEAVAAERVSGQFVTGDTDAFLAAVEAVYGLKVIARTPREIRLAAR